MGHVVLKSVSDPQPVAVQDGRGRPYRRPQQGAKQASTAESRKRVVQELARGRGWQLDGPDGLRPSPASDDCLARSASGADPVDLTERCLEEASIAELEHRDRRRARLPAPASTDGQQDVRFAQAAAQEKAYERADPAKDRGGKSLPKVNLRRIGIRSHLYTPSARCLVTSNRLPRSLI